MGQKSLCNLLILSIKQSLFPDQLIEKLKPLFKKGSKTDPNNYRLISLLLAVRQQRKSFTFRFMSIYNKWFTFSNGFFNKYLLCTTYGFYLDGMDKGFHTGMVLVDLQTGLIR